MAEMDEETAQPVFRAAKRQRIWRRRSDEQDEDAASSKALGEATNETPTHSEGSKTRVIGEVEPEHGEQGPAVTASPVVLRGQRFAKVRKSGISFAKNQTESQQWEQSLEPSMEQAPSAIEQANSRFVPQMGLMTQETIENCERHMASYVDSKIAEIHGCAASSDTRKSRSIQDLPRHIPLSGNGQVQKPATEFEALQEVDLGPESMLQNIARTEAARRKLVTGDFLDPEPELSKRVRLGRNGKPRKNRNRRGSVDIKRDEMVEQLMRETRLGMFQEPEAPNEPDDGKATDDRVAQQFWQEYMEQVNFRNMRKAANNPPAPSNKATKVEASQKGPKLGGSRSARAAMKAQEEKAAKKQ
ncbi:MAG: hypothetical protein Q9165_008342 [Trypethelium subeluteriae]